MPLRAEYIRVIAAELNRIASHLVSFGTYGLDMGAFTPFLYAFREREYILDLFEQLCGARLTLSYINVGGVTWDLPPRFLEKLTEFLDYFEPKIDEYNDLLSFNHIFIKRTANVGVVSKDSRITYALVRPDDPRQRHPARPPPHRPYCIYHKLDFDVCAGQGLRGTIRRLLGPLLGEDAGDEAVRPDPPPVHRADARWPLLAKLPRHLKFPPAKSTANSKTPAAI